MCIFVRAGWRDKVEKEPEWRGILPCVGDCPAKAGEPCGTYHLGFAAKRRGTLYGAPIVPLGRSSVGYIACEMCRKGTWHGRDDYESLGREAVANLATFAERGATQPKAIWQQYLDAPDSHRDWMGLMACSYCADELHQQGCSTVFAGVRAREMRGDGNAGGYRNCVICLRCKRGYWLADDDYREWGAIAHENLRVASNGQPFAENSVWMRNERPAARTPHRYCTQCGAPQYGVLVGCDYSISCDKCGHQGD